MSKRSSNLTAKQWLLVSVIVSVAGSLTACGGGGAEDFAHTTPTSGSQQPTATPKSGTAATPVTPASPAVPQGPVKDPNALVDGAELAPTLAAPQAGSTALVGENNEGIYEGSPSITFVTSVGRIMHKDVFQWVVGNIDLVGNNWTFRSPTLAVEGTSGAGSFVTGSGAFDPKHSMTGQATGITPGIWGPLIYSPANALALTQAEMAGTWTSTGSNKMSIKVDETGKFTGTTAGIEYGYCGLTGTLLQVKPGSQQNMFEIKMVPVNKARETQTACKLTVDAYSGLGAVLLFAAGNVPSNGYFRSFAFNAVSTGSGFFTSVLNKQR